MIRQKKLHDEKIEFKAKLVLALDVERVNVWLEITVEEAHDPEITGGKVIKIRAKAIMLVFLDFEFMFKFYSKWLKNYFKG